jgi:flagellar basal body-associated protein FliL
MSDKKEEKKAPAAEEKKGGEHGKEGATKGGGMGGLLKKTPVLLAAVMVIEGVVLIAGLKFIGGGPKNAPGAEVSADKGDEKGGEGKPGEKKGQVELQLVDFRAPNKQSGKTFLYDVAIFVTTKADNGDKLKELITDDDALIKDRVRTIIATIDPEKLGGGSEPGLETLRRQVKYQLDQILPDGKIDEVLVPRCIPFRTDY